jgi:hypothetical protein
MVLTWPEGVLNGADTFHVQKQLLGFLIDHFGGDHCVLVSPCGDHADTATRLVPWGPFVVDRRGTIKVTLSDVLHIEHTLTNISVVGSRYDKDDIPVKGNWYGWYSPSLRWMHPTVILPLCVSVTVYEINLKN